MSDGDEAADVEVVDIVHHLGKGVGIGGREATVIGGEKELTYFFFEGHGAEGGVDPLGLLGSQRNERQSGVGVRRSGLRGGAIRIFGTVSAASFSGHIG